MRILAILLGRALFRFHGWLIALLGFALWVFYFFRAEGFLQSPSVYGRFGFLAVLLALLAYRTVSFFRSNQDTAWHDLENAILTLLTLNIILQVSGPYQDLLYPLNILLLILIVAFSNIKIGLAMTLFLSALFILQAHLQSTLFIDAEKLIFQTLLSLFFVGFIGEFILLERAQREKAQRALDKLLRDGRQLDPTVQREGMGRIGREAREQSNVDHLFVQDRLLGRLAELCRRALLARSAVIMSLDMDGRQLSVDALASIEDDIDIDANLDVENSIFRFAIADRQPVFIDKLSASSLPGYYRRRVRIKSIAMAPIFRADHVIGVVAVDSDEPEHFGQLEMEFLQLVAEQVVENFDMVRMIRNTQYEREQSAAFYEVANEVSSALKIEQVLRVILTASSAVVHYDAAALTLVSEDDPESSVIQDVFNLDEGKYKGQSFKHSEGLIGWVTQIKTYLSQPDFSAVQRPIFSAKISVKGIESLLCLPLVMKDQAIGALSFFWASPNAFSDSDRKVLEVLTLQAAVSLENARIYEKMEKMAITDGLTGLHNHRYFQEWLVSEIVRTERMPIKLSMILLDIDYFKKINDTYGHPVGDLVLKHLSNILRSSIRHVDLAARYGGEEFALVLLESDKKGAMKFAERLRKEIQNTKIKYPDGHLSITVSLGISTFPDMAFDKQSLIDQADTALYHSKRNGRNRATYFDDLPPVQKLAENEAK